MKFHIVCSLFIATTLLTGCLSDAHDKIRCSDEAVVDIALYIGELDVVETRSMAIPNERLIEDAYVLIFGADGKYVDGEKIDVGTNLRNNGEQKPVITTALIPQVGQKFVVLANTGIAALPTSLVAGTSTVDDINDAFPSTNWNINRLDEGKYMPMSGTMVYGTDTQCELVRACAKIEVVFADDLPANDVTGAFYWGNPDFRWGIYNVLIPNKGSLYSPDYQSGCLIPTTVSAADFTGLYYDTTVSPMPMPQGTSFYATEYPSATYAKGVAITGSRTFDMDRTCIGLEFKDKMYYRLDLIDQAGNYLDIRRNCHYKIIISKVLSTGYPSLSEALTNPGGNIEFEVIVTGKDDNHTISNGQYALSMSADKISIFDDSDASLLNFSLTKGTDAPLNLSTAIVDIVDATKTANVTISPCLTINSIAATMQPNGFEAFDLGGQTDSRNFILNIAAHHEDQAAVAALKGCYLRIRMGNLTQYVPIAVEDVTFYYGQANCIEIPERAGTYSFDATPYTTTSYTYAYQNIPDNELAQPLSAAMLWSDVSSTHLSNISVTYDIHGQHTLQFTCDGTAGNAVIAIYDTPNPADPAARMLWSFHVWVSPRDVASDQNWSVMNFNTNVLTPNRYVMMDRNLGATSTVRPTAATYTNVSSLGMLYQWGRKDPFVGSSSYVNVKHRTMYTPSGTTDWTSTTSSVTAGTVTYAVTHPTEFILSVNNGDWIFDSGGTYYTSDKQALWGCPEATFTAPASTTNNKSVYDPCPEGYRVASSDAFGILLRSGTFSFSPGNGVTANDGQSYNVYAASGSVAMTYPQTNFGLDVYYQSDKSGPTTFLPNVGVITGTTGAFTNGAKGSGLMWTNAALSSGNRYAARCSWSLSSFNPVWPSARAHAHGVRCCKE